MLSAALLSRFSEQDQKFVRETVASCKTLETGKGDQLEQGPATAQKPVIAPKPGTADAATHLLGRRLK